MSTSEAMEVAQSHAVMARHAKSFRVASWFLAPGVRDDAAVLYAFCRAVDDAADESPNRETALAALAELEAGLAQGDLAVTRLVREMAARRGVSLVAAAELIEGARGDLALVRIPDDAALLHYAYLVAGTVGLMMCSLLGARDPRAQRRAVDLGIAMQLTNICRDVLEDAAIDRVYLPEDRLRAAGTSSEELIARGSPKEAVARVISDLLDMADQHYVSADAGMRDLPLRSRLAVVVASRVYRAIGVRLRARGCDPMRGRVIVSPLGKLYYAARGVVAWVALSLGFGGRAPSPEAALPTHLPASEHPPHARSSLS